MILKMYTMIHYDSIGINISIYLLIINFNSYQQAKMVEASSEKDKRDDILKRTPERDYETG